MGQQIPKFGELVITLTIYAPPSVQRAEIIREKMQQEKMQNATRGKIKLFGGGVLPTANYFNMFDYRELIENMRQRADKKFGDIMLNARVQALTEIDIENLNNCIIDSESGENRVTMEEAAAFYVDKQISSEEEGGDPTILALFATNAEVDTFNNLVMAARDMEIISVLATDSYSVKSRGTAAQRNRNTFARPYQTMENDLIDSAEAAARRIKYSRKKGRGNQAFTDAEEDSNLTGGLPKMLRVAKNGRVMLRRNVNTAIGLVNGATGTLMDVEADSEGHVETLLIKFDGIEDVQKITKLTAVFDIGLDDQIARTQFPIVSAFAATVHKCQGLTLQNVLISTRAFFAPGMAFVAFSRVTSMKGLHLMDFSEGKVWCDLTSLRKYNDLRDSIGLPKFEIPRPRKNKGKVAPSKVRSEVTTEISVPTNNITETPTTSRRRRKIVENDDSECEVQTKRPMIGKPHLSDTSKRIRSNVKPVRRGKINYESDASSTDSPAPTTSKRTRRSDTNNIEIAASFNDNLTHPSIDVLPQNNVVQVMASCLTSNGVKLGYRFLNRQSTDCFANTASNSFFCLESLMTDLSTAPVKNRVIEMLLDAYNETPDPMRLPMEANFQIRDHFYPNLSDQDDAADMIQKLIDNLEDVVGADGSLIQDNFRVHIEMTVPCQGCEDPITWTSLSLCEFMVKLGYIDDTPRTIEELLKRRAIKESFGDSHVGCAVNAYDDSRKVQVTTTDMPKYLVVVIEGEQITRDEKNNIVRTRYNIPVKDIHARHTKIFGTRYRLRGAVQYQSHGKGQHSRGHYLFWWKTPNDYSIVNDNVYNPFMRQIPNYCKGMRVLIFEKY